MIKLDLNDDLLKALYAAANKNNKTLYAHIRDVLRESVK